MKLKDILIISLSLTVLSACTNNNKANAAQPQKQSATKTVKTNVAKQQKIKRKAGVVELTTSKEFQDVVENSKDRLLIFDLYADWCMPCKMLSPMLEEIAKEQSDKADFYKVNVDKVRDVAAAFRVRSIPFVVFVKNKVGVNAMVGVQPKQAYIEAINKLYKIDTDSLVQNSKK